MLKTSKIYFIFNSNNLNNRSFCIFLILLLLSFNIVLIINSGLLKNKISESLGIIDNLKNEVDFFINKIKIENSCNNYSLDENLLVVNINGDSIKVKEIITETKLILRYSVLNCDACVNVELQNLKNLIVESKVEKNKIILFVYYEKLGDLISTYRSLNIDISLYIIPQKKFNLEIEEQNTPYYFIINPALSISNIFIPRKSYNQLTMHYLKSVYENVLIN